MYKGCGGGTSSRPQSKILCIGLPVSVAGGKTGTHACPCGFSLQEETPRQPSLALTDPFLPGNKSQEQRWL